MLGDIRGWLGCELGLLAVVPGVLLIFLGNVRVYAPPPTVPLHGGTVVGRPPPLPILVPAWEVTTLGLALLGVPVAAAGSVAGLTARRTRPGRVAAVGGLVAVLVNVGSLALDFGRGMAWPGAAG